MSPVNSTQTAGMHLSLTCDSGGCDDDDDDDDNDGDDDDGDDNGNSLLHVVSS